MGEEYISKKALIKQIDEEQPQNWTNSEAEVQEQIDWRYFRSLVATTPAADVVEVRRGKWIDDDLSEGVICSLCGYVDYTFNYNQNEWGSNYCPNCGAKMDLEDDSNENK